MANSPLHGLRIVVTRPRDQAIQLAKRIEQEGGIPLLFPLLEISTVSDTRKLQEQVSRLKDFAYAIFVSPNAVQYGIAAIRSMGEIPDSIRIATIGQGSVKALLDLGITNVLAPSERFDSEGLLELHDLQEVAGMHIIIFRGDSGRELLGNTLKARGAVVEYATCYHRRRSQLDVKSLLEKKPDAISITSSEAMTHLWQSIGDGERIKMVEIPVFVQHERIAELARKQGWQYVHITGPGDEGLMSAMVEWSSNE